MTQIEIESLKLFVDSNLAWYQINSMLMTTVTMNEIQISVIFEPNFGGLVMNVTVDKVCGYENLAHSHTLNVAVLLIFLSNRYLLA